MLVLIAFIMIVDMEIIFKYNIIVIFFFFMQNLLNWRYFKLIVEYFSFSIFALVCIVKLDLPHLKADRL